MRNEKEIRTKLRELYRLIANPKTEDYIRVRYFLATDILSWVLGGDCLETNEEGEIEW